MFGVCSSSKNVRVEAIGERFMTSSIEAFSDAVVYVNDQMNDVLTPDFVDHLRIRALGVVFAVAFLSLALQTRDFGGRDGGVSPLFVKLEQIKDVFPSLFTRMAYYPTLFWLVPTTTNDETKRGSIWLEIAL